MWKTWNRKNENRQPKHSNLNSLPNQFPLRKTKIRELKTENDDLRNQLKKINDILTIAIGKINLNSVKKVEFPKESLEAVKKELENQLRQKKFYEEQFRRILEKEKKGSGLTRLNSLD